MKHPVHNAAAKVLTGMAALQEAAMDALQDDDIEYFVKILCILTGYCATHHTELRQMLDQLKDDENLDWIDLLEKEIP